jgi:hypothetical protein
MREALNHPTTVHSCAAYETAKGHRPPDVLDAGDRRRSQCEKDPASLAMNCGETLLRSVLVRIPLRSCSSVMLEKLGESAET